VSPLTAIIALVFSAVMQYLEVVTLTGQLSPQEKQTLVLALAFAPTVLLALGILRRLSEGGNTGALGELFGWLGNRLGSADPKKSRAYSFDIELPKRKTRRPFRRGSKRAR
jgi:hypothetical protein